MDDHANPPPDEPSADENDQRPAISANADLSPRFVDLVMYQLDQHLLNTRAMMSWFDIETDPAEQTHVFNIIRSLVVKTQRQIRMVRIAVKLDREPVPADCVFEPELVDIRPGVVKMVETLRSMAAAISAERRERSAGDSNVHRYSGPVAFSSAIPAETMLAWVTPGWSSWLFDTLAAVIDWLDPSDSIEISGSQEAEAWAIAIVFRGFWIIALEDEWGAYQEQQRLILAPSSMEGLALALLHKVARLHGGDLDLHFASGPPQPGQKPGGNQLTIALRLRRADRA